MTTMTFILKRVGGFHNLNLVSKGWAKSLDACCFKYFALWLSGLATKWMKYHCAALFARGNGQELPEGIWGENPGMFMGGTGFVALHYLVQYGGKELRHFNFRFKKGLPGVHRVELLLAERDFLVQLSTEHKPKISDESGDTVGASFLSMIRDSYPYGPNSLSPEQYRCLGYTERLRLLMDQVVRTTYELFHDYKGSKSLMMEIPSLSSHYQSERKTGGALGYIMDLFRKYRESVEDQKSGEQSFIDLLMQIDLDLPDLLNSRVPGHIDWQERELSCFLKREPYLKCQSCTDEFENEEIYNNRDRRKDLLRGFINHVFQQVEHEPNIVVPQALPEALKVRMITRGPALRYWFGKAIQKVVHRALRNHPTFVAIGRPLCSRDLEDTLLPLGEGESFLSGDYKSATDLLHPDLCLAAVDTICFELGWSDSIRDIFRNGLVGADIHGSSKVRQEWGQLMGSPMSFPILCIVNAAVNRFYYEMVNGVLLPKMSCKGGIFSLDLQSAGIKLKETPMLVNGDDIVLRAPDTQYTLWNMMVNDCGLVPSIGKNYLSKDFAVINSTYYEFMDCEVGNFCELESTQQFQELGTLNTGLLYPDLGGKFHKVNGRWLSDKAQDLGSISWDLVRGFENDFNARDFLLSRFVSGPEVGPLLRDLPGRLSWYVDKKLGGYGIYCCRPELMSPSTVEYYSRVADEFEFTPLAGLYDTSNKLGLRDYLRDADMTYDLYDQDGDTGFVANEAGFTDSWDALIRILKESGEDRGNKSFMDYVNCAYVLNRRGADEARWGLNSLYVPKVPGRREFFRRDTERSGLTDWKQLVSFPGCWRVIQDWGVKDLLNCDLSNASFRPVDTYSGLGVD